MKKLIGVIAAAALAPALLVTTPAEAATAAPANPVAALRKQLVPGKGVQFRTTTKHAGKIAHMGWGTLQFGRSGVTASEVTVFGRDDEGKLETIRMITLKDVYYFFVPSGSGRNWAELRVKGARASGLDGSLSVVDVTVPAVLKTLLTGAKAKRSGKTWVYSGTTTIGALWKITPGLKDAGAKLPAKIAKVKVAWKLHVGADRLVQRAISTYDFGPFRSGKYRKFLVTTDTRYTHWGGKVKIKTPSDDQIVDFTPEEAPDDLILSGPTP